MVKREQYSTHKPMPTKLDSERATRGSVALPLLILTLVKSNKKITFYSYSIWAKLLVKHIYKYINYSLIYALLQYVVKPFSNNFLATQ